MWVVPHVLLVPTAIVMVRKGLHKDFRVFFFYLLFEFVQFGVLFTMWCLKAPHLTLIGVDQLARSGSAAFRFGMIQEMLESPLAGNVPLRQTMGRMFYWVTALLIVLALVSIEPLYSSLPNYDIFKGYTPIEAMNIAQCGLLFCVFLWYRFLGVRMSPCVLGIALGIGWVTAFEPFMLPWVSGQHLIRRDSLQMLPFHMAAVGWLSFVLVRQSLASNFNTAQLLQVRDWADGVGRITRR